MLGLFTRKRGHKAHMGEENRMYYNKELGRWVERGKENEVADETVPPPPLAASTATSTQRRMDEGDPASRYVAAGDFGRRTPPGTEAKKTFMTPPTLAATTPLTGGFFVPTPPPPKSETETSEPTSPQGVERYKGYCIPTFTKPEGFAGTQEEYAAVELQKFKEKIDRREARKNSSAPKTAPAAEVKENGVHIAQPKTGGAKLDNSWLTENGGHGFDHQQPCQEAEETKQQDAIDEAFGIAYHADPFAPPRETDLEEESQPAQLFPVEPEQQPETQHAFDQPFPPQSHDPFSGQADATEWPTAEGQATYAAPVDEAAANDGWSLSDHPSGMAENGRPDLVEAEMPGDSFISQEGQYAEAAYPGAVRDSDDPYDTAWLTRNGWTELETCQAITVWMCQTYQDTWRTWHKDDPFWESFWNWYYDGGYDVIHPSTQQENVPELTNNEIIQATKEVAAAAEFFNEGIQNDPTIDCNAHSMQEMPEVLPVEDVHAAASVEDQIPPPSLPQDVTKAPSMEKEAQNEGAVTEEFIPESDEDIWKMPEEEEEYIPEEKPVVSIVPDVAVEENLPVVLPPKEDLSFCPVSTGKGATTKLSSWEDEFLFSLPDPWEEGPSSEAETDDGRLPFAIFNHQGMLRFLQKVDGLLTELNQNNSISAGGTVGPFHDHVRQLIRAVELSGHPLHEGKDMGECESELLRRDMETKESEMQDLKSKLSTVETDWNSKLSMVQQENAELQSSYQSMTQSLKEQEEKALEATMKLQQTESQIETNKRQVSDLMEQLKEKDVQLGSLHEDLSSKDNEIAHLCAELAKKDGESVIPEEVTLEMEDLKKEIASLKAAAQEKTAPTSPSSPDLHKHTEIQAELKQQIMTLQKKLLQQDKTIEENETEIARLMALDHGNGFSANSNEMDAIDEWMDQVAERDLEIAQLKETLQANASRIAALERELQQKSAENTALTHSPDRSIERELNLKDELEKTERQIERLELEIQDKAAEVQRLTALLESVPKKDHLITKLTQVLNEKDNELFEVRKRIQEGNERESDLIERLTAKDGDLENVVHSLLFSQHQVTRLCSYCNELGGDPQELLGSLQAVE